MGLLSKSDKTIGYFCLAAAAYIAVRSLGGCAGKEEPLELLVKSSPPATEAAHEEYLSYPQPTEKKPEKPQEKKEIREQFKELNDKVNNFEKQNPGFIKDYKLSLYSRLPAMDLDRKSIEDMVLGLSEQAGINKDLVNTLVKTESDHQWDAVSKTGARGVTQIKRRNAGFQDVIEKSFYPPNEDYRRVKALEMAREAVAPTDVSKEYFSDLFTLINLAEKLKGGQEWLLDQDISKAKKKQARSKIIDYTRFITSTRKKIKKVEDACWEVVEAHPYLGTVIGIGYLGTLLFDNSGDEHITARELVGTLVNYNFGNTTKFVPEDPETKGYVQKITGKTMKTMGNACYLPEDINTKKMYKLTGIPLSEILKNTPGLLRDGVKVKGGQFIHAGNTKPSVYMPFLSNDGRG